MEDPYRKIRKIGQATEKLAADNNAAPDRIFAESQKRLNELADIELEHASITVEWEQYMSSVRTTLHHMQAKARPQIDRHLAAQITIQTQAELGRDKVKEQEDLRRRRRARKKKIKLAIITASVVISVLSCIGMLIFYQWSVLNSNEGWFHDLSQKNWTSIEKRMRLGRSVETADHMGMTGLLYLARTGTLEDLKQMQQLGANLYVKDNSGRTALHHAAANADHKSVEWLISQGIDVNVKDVTGTTPLHYFFLKAPGSRYGLETYHTLLGKGARTDTFNQEESLLMAAVLWVRGGAFDERPADILQVLIDKGANVNHRGLNGASALDSALVKYLPETPKPLSLFDSDPVVKVLLKNGATQEDQNLLLTEELQYEEEQRIEFAPGL
ncbi:MAG: ankyrin repeat domain-containing protein [Verrucomicrobiota bacterium]